MLHKKSMTVPAAVLAAPRCNSVFYCYRGPLSASSWQNTRHKWPTPVFTTQGSYERFDFMLYCIISCELICSSTHGRYHHQQYQQTWLLQCSVCCLSIVPLQRVQMWLTQGCGWIAVNRCQQLIKYRIAWKGGTDWWLHSAYICWCAWLKLRMS